MELLSKITDLEEQSIAQIAALKKIEDLEKFRVEITGKKGKLTAILRGLGKASPEERRESGKHANLFKSRFEKELENRRLEIEEDIYNNLASSESYDSGRLPKAFSDGHYHPITSMQREIEDIFTSMGFSVLDGPEIEEDYYNFTALNFTEDHPARDMQDTFWTKQGTLLRTHTSPIQVRGMEMLEPPYRVVAPGRVYRYEEIDASHEHTFYQVEGMMVAKKISVSNLIYIMKTLLKEIFQADVRVRLRPGYFPFVEPGFELDMHCLLCDGKGCSVCKKSGWVEVLPCGLVHPNVLRSGGLDPEVWQGFAFGLGLNRLIMMRYGIEDIRHFQSGNLRFLKQF